MLDYVKFLFCFDDLYDKYGSVGNMFYYFLILLSLYGVILECLVVYGLIIEEFGWKCIIVEKLFGYDI